MRNFFQSVNNVTKAPATVLPIFPASSLSTASAPIISPSCPEAIRPAAPTLFPIFACESKRGEGKNLADDIGDAKNSETGRYVNTTGLADFSKHASLVPRIISQNVNSLSYYACSKAGQKRNAKIKSTLKDYVKAADIICLQETNLSTDDCFALSSLNGCLISRNNFEMGSAGTAIIDTPAILKWYNPSDISLPPCCRGYIQARNYSPKGRGHLPFTLINCYFFTGAKKQQRQSDLVKALRQIKVEGEVFMIGDFNFIRRVEDSNSTTPSFPSIDFLEEFDDLCAYFQVAEVLQDEYTYFHVTADVDSSRSHCSRLDKCFIPASLFHSALFFPNLNIWPHATNYKLPTPGRKKFSFSDHLPIRLSFGVEMSTDKASKRIPRWLAEAPEFASELKVRWEPRENSCPFRALKAYKETLYRVAAATRKRKLESSSASLRFSHLLSLYRLISRLNQDRPRIIKILSFDPSLDSLVKLCNGRYCDDGLESAAREALLKSDSFATKARKNPISSIKELLPNSRVCISHLRAEPSDKPKFDLKGKTEVAKNYWEKVWAKRKEGPSAGEKARYLDSYDKKIKNAVVLPTVQEIKDTILGTGNTSPGPDGIAFAAWRAAPDLAAPLLHRILVTMSKGQPPPEGFNFGLLFLLPKTDSGLAGDTRPLSVTNTENRILAAAVARAVMPAVIGLVEGSQKGFLWEQSGADHTTNINSWFYHGVESKKQKLLFLLDTNKAFDSIDHDWIRLVLRKAGFPPWVQLFVKGTLTNVKVAPYFGVEPSEWIGIFRGVKQGCPLSPLLFVLAYDPLLYQLGKNTWVRCFAFADDLAITALSLSDFIFAFYAIDQFALHTGLGINKKKSCVVSSGDDASNDSLRHELEQCPWPDLPLRDKAVHLGIPIGREVTLGDVFEKPMRKAEERLRTSAVVVKGLSVLSRCLFVNVFIVSLFSYHCCFYLLPKEFLDSTRKLISKLVIPFNGGAYSYETLLCLDLLLGIKPALKDLWSFNVSLLAARSDFINSRANYNELPLISIVYSRVIKSHRDCAAIDYWRGRHLPDGTLLPLAATTSTAIYRSLIADVYLEEVTEKLGEKVAKFVGKNSEKKVAEPMVCIDNITRNMVRIKHIPLTYRFFQFSLLNNALATSRRRRHQEGKTVAEVAKCYYCGIGEDSVAHLFERCKIVREARNQLMGKTLDNSLSSAFLIDCAASDIASLICFNYAVWNFREKAAGAWTEKGAEWRQSRLVELTRTFLERCKKPVRRSGHHEKDDDSEHDLLVESAGPKALICYTDGSALGNPGPAGAGAVVFDFSNNTATDLGVSLGVSTNNVGELTALWATLHFVVNNNVVGPVLIFSDSLYALNAIKGGPKKKTVAHAELVTQTRELLTIALHKRVLSLHWIRGHANLGGNERADRIAKAYAQASKTATTSYPITESGIQISQREWHSNLLQTPLCAFLWNIPIVRSDCNRPVMQNVILELKHDEESIESPRGLEPPGISIVRRSSTRVARPPPHFVLS